MGKEIIALIDSGFEGIVSKAKKKTKAEFFIQALEIMEDKLGIQKTREIFEANGCCKSGARLKASKEFRRINADLCMEDKLAKIRRAPYMNMGSPALDENGEIVVNAVRYCIDGKYACACPSISRQPIQPESKIYCYCCAGHFKFHYEIMLGCKLMTAEIVSSPLTARETIHVLFGLRLWSSGICPFGFRLLFLPHLQSFCITILFFRIVKQVGRYKREEKQ